MCRMFHQKSYISVTGSNGVTFILHFVAYALFGPVYPAITYIHMQKKDLKNEFAIISFSEPNVTQYFTKL